MTAISTAQMDFLVRVKKMDQSGVKPREVLMLWAIAREPGMMGRELAVKLGYASRSNVQIGIRRLLDMGLITDHRTVRNHQTPNDLYITPAGETFIAGLVPQ